MKRLLFLVTLTVLVASKVSGVPAKSRMIEHEQPDGSIIKVKLCGDEYHHYYMTEEGAFVTLDADGYYKYTVLDTNNRLVAGTQRATNAGIEGFTQREVGLRHKEQNSLNRALRNPMQAPFRKSSMHRVNRKSSEVEDTKGLIILVNFKDESFVTPVETINDLMNKEGFTDSYGSIGSARDYFIAQSYGAFKPKFDIVGPVTLSKHMSYYGSNDDYGMDIRPDVMVSEACEIASDSGLVDMSDYDLDDDGWVDLVYIIYAGNAESSGAPISTIWPHAWYIYQGAGREVTIDGVKLDAYACSSELYDLSDNIYDGIGTFCHEYSHTLGLPDMYDIDGSGAMGMHYWSIMSSGNYCENGYVPLGYSAYERSYCGWLELNELDTPTSVSMPDLKDDKSAAYRVSSSNENQYIILETRNRRGWDKGLDAEGMMVTAIDFYQPDWDDNGPNDNPSRQRIKLIPADNKWNTSTTQGDLYPYNGNNELTSTSTPAMKVHNTLIEDKPITEITHTNGVIDFVFMGGSSLEVPTATSADIITNGFTAYWSPVAGATSYTLYVERVNEDAVQQQYMNETFDSFTANKDTDISTSLDDYTSTPGWSGVKVFCNSGEVKLGSSKASGSITTPELSITGNIVAQFDTKLYNDSENDGTIYIHFTNEDGNVSSYECSEVYLSSSSFSNLKCDYYNESGSFTVTIEGGNRIYIDNMIVKNTEAEIPDTEPSQVVESCMIEGITNTYCDVTEVINPITSGTYNYKVRAHNDMGYSGWSNVISVTFTGESSSLESHVANDTNIYAAHGNIYISNESTSKAYIYNMQGHLEAVVNVDEGTTCYAPSSSGLYLVRCGDRVAKVMVK